MSPEIGITRRGMLVAGGAVVLGAASGCARSETGASATPTASPTASSGPVAQTLPFYGEHQSGIETPATILQTFIGLNLTSPDRDSAEAALRLISDDAARLTQGEPALGDTEPDIAVNPDHLTVTVGLGPEFFTAAGLRQPEQLRDIPAFTTDAFEDPWTQTDLMVQVGSNDALTLAHAIRMLTKDLSALATVAWTQDGFRSLHPANPGSGATRNLMGQVDGTINPASDTADFEEVVWIPTGPPGVKGGTVLVLRRIRMLLDTWEQLDVTAQELAIGRRQSSGAPLGKTQESDPMPWDEKDDLGLPLIPANAHARVAHAADNASSILRRPYNYDAGMRDGTNDVGLLFAAYMRDPQASFIPMQERIAKSDAFNTWNTTIGSATYFIPAGATANGFVGEGLFQ